MELIYLLTGLAAGALIGWLIAGRTAASSVSKAKEVAQQQISELQMQLARSTANNEALNDKLQTQQGEMDRLGKKFTTEFENIANRILEVKSARFTELNKTNLAAVLDPLGKNIEEFKKVVNEVYTNESRERFSLGKHVEELARLNRTISEEARNLTNALKGETKTQGRWGEMILESILEKSGLRKDEEYFMEHQLTDGLGNPLRSDAEGKKMRPDAVIRYPDNRNVIIDSKVSLNAYLRFIESKDAAEQKKELDAHVAAVKNHIVALSSRGYDDFDKSLDFVMMFIPSEPAYSAVLQADPDIWSFAYDKRILLLSPTNLITSLKLIVDLWKREKYNRNAQEIADRGARMYDKLVGFVANMEEIGRQLDKTRDTYDASFKQLSTGKDNLINQAARMKNLGLKAKKDFAEELIDKALEDDGIEGITVNAEENVVE